MPQIQTRNPATKEPLETYGLMTKEEAFAKIDAAHAAFEKWRELSHEDRAPVLRKIAEVLRENSDRFSELMTRETGKLLRDGRTEVELCARLFEYTADNGPDELADEERKHSGGKKRGIVTYSPMIGE
ncbi:MAG: aldehyde dehydrogenase family protein, partial [Pseudomonadota bacterium]